MTSVRLYSYLLKLYPRSFKEEFAEEMEFVFGEMSQEVYQRRGPSGLISLWLQTSHDLTQSLISQHVQKYRKGDFMKNNALLRPAVATVGLLLIPLVAMLFNTGVNWDETDFIVMGGLIFAIGLALEMVIRHVRSTQQRVLLGLALLAVFMLIWAELAVGLFGTPFAGS